MIQVPKNNKFRKTRNRLGQENPKKEVEPIAPNSEAESQTKCTMLLLLLLFLTFSALVANPKKLLYTVANPARGLLNREKKKKKKSGSAPPPPPARAARSEKK